MAPGLAVQGLGQAQLAAGRQAEGALLVPAAQHVAQLAVGTLVVVPGDHLRTTKTGDLRRFPGSGFILCVFFISGAARLEKIWRPAAAEEANGGYLFYLCC